MTNPKADWREIMMGRVDARLASPTAKKNATRDVRTHLTLSGAGAVTRAAAEREMSRAAYVRRAVLAFAAYDLGLDLAQLLADEPPTRLRLADPHTDVQEAGQGHGNWVIEGLK